MAQNLSQKTEYPQGIKWTRQRKCVYQVLLDAAEPLSAQQIYALTEKKSQEEPFALSTVYRILETFEEKGLVERTVWMDSDTAVYELERGGHKHYAVCLECHKRIPLKGCPFVTGHLGHKYGEQKENDLSDFTVTDHKLELYGYCGNCREKRG